MDKKAIIEETEKYYLPVFGRYPMVMELGQGCRVWDNEGNEYVDAFAGIAVNSLGYNHPVLVKAISEQASKLMHCSNLYYTEIQAKALRMVAEATGMDRIFFANCGAEGNEGAMKLARKYGVSKAPTKYKIISADESFHGRTFDTLAATGHDYYHVGYGPLSPGHVLVPYGDIKALEAQMDDDVCAVLLEPIQGEGGVHPATMEFMQGLRKFCDENDMLLLIDEVQTGWCRTGAVMSYMNYGIKPDIVSMAKALGGGMPIGAICATAEVAKAFTAGSHGTTFGGHPVSCAAALAEVNELLDRDLAGNAKKVGDYFASKLEKLPHVKEVRHQGLLVGVEFDDTIGGVDVKHGCLDRKLLITAIGAHIIRMIPPLIVTEEECDKAVAIIEDTIKSLEK